MSWSCQRCRQPLLLHPSVSSEIDLNQSAYDLVQDSFIAPRHASSPSTSKALLPSKESSSEAAPTTASSSSSAGLSTNDPNSLSARLAASSALFDLLSHPPRTKTGRTSPSASRSGKKALRLRTSNNSSTVIDHPLCKACTDTLLEIMDTQMSEVRSQRDSYLAFEAELRKYKLLPQIQRRVSSSSSPSVATEKDMTHDLTAIRQQQLEECKSLQHEIAQLLSDESFALSELKEAEAARLSIEAQLSTIAEQEAALQQEEERFWSQYSQHSLTLSRLEEDKASLAMAVAHDRELLLRLQSTNVYTDAFCIGHSGGIATINGLRLGRLPGQSVEWNEINAAWGQTALLLDVVARKLGVAFRGYRLIPKGSFSVVHRYEDARSQHYSSASSTSTLFAASNDATETEGEETAGEKTVYELYGSSDWQIGRLLQSRRFDHAQTGFLACLKQVVEFAASADPTFQAPHAINKDKIGEASIRLQFGSDETWTRALRHVLVNCNRVLMWVSEREKRQVQQADGRRAMSNGQEADTRLGQDITA